LAQPPEQQSEFWLHVPFEPVQQTPLLQVPLQQSLSPTHAPPEATHWQYLVVPETHVMLPQQSAFVLQVASAAPQQ
jgi:hypothetical protein